LKLAWESHARGEFQLGGVLADPVDGALLWFIADSPAVVEAFVAATRTCAAAWSPSGASALG